MKNEKKKFRLFDVSAHNIKDDLYSICYALITFPSKSSNKKQSFNLAFLVRASWCYPTLLRIWHLIISLRNDTAESRS